jgi:hypothetical protein
MVRSLPRGKKWEHPDYGTNKAPHSELLATAQTAALGASDGTRDSQPAAGIHRKKALVMSNGCEKGSLA